MLIYCMADVNCTGQSSPCRSPESRTDDKSQSPAAVPAMLVMSGGEGYIDFRVDCSNTGNIFCVRSSECVL